MTMLQPATFRDLPFLPLISTRVFSCPPDLPHHSTTLTRHTSHLAPHASLLQPHTSHLTPYTSRLLECFRKSSSGDASLMEERGYLGAKAIGYTTVFKQTQEI